MDPSAVGVVANSLVKEGILGSIILVLLLVCGALWKAYSKSNAARLSDAKAYTDKYVGLLEKMMEKDADMQSILEIIKDRMGSRRS